MVAVYVNLEVVFVFVLEADNVQRNCRHLFLKQILGLGSELEPGTCQSFSFVN